MIKYLKCEVWDYKKKESTVQYLPIRVSYSSLKKMKETINRSISIDDDGTDYEAYEELLFLSLEKGYKMVGEKMPYERKDMEDVMDSVWNQFSAIVPEFFSDDELEFIEKERLLTQKKLEKLAGVNEAKKEKAEKQKSL